MRIGPQASGATLIVCGVLLILLGSKNIDTPLHGHRVFGRWIGWLQAVLGVVLAVVGFALIGVGL